ncbi:hypothetical protein QX227_08105 [Pectobacterium aroidearum]|uniref:hypothetical protein n=1 Tax=Pectobacterium aroidearum TaxID=1201031 RepID=UPI002FCB4D68
MEKPTLNFPVFSLVIPLSSEEKYQVIKFQSGMAEVIAEFNTPQEVNPCQISVIQNAGDGLLKRVELKLGCKLGG